MLVAELIKENNAVYHICRGCESKSKHLSCVNISDVDIGRGASRGRRGCRLWRGSSGLGLLGVTHAREALGHELVGPCPSWVELGGCRSLG